MTPGLHVLEPGGSIGARRDWPVVCIPVYGAHSLFVACLRSVLSHTPLDVPIVVADDASPDRDSEAFVREIAAGVGFEHEFWYLLQPHNLGFVENVNTVFDATAPADVILLNSDTEVGPEWAERLRAAAYSDTTIATASAFTNHGTILSVPFRNQPQPDLPPGLAVDPAATAVAEASLRLYPRIPTALGHCVYVRRSAIDLVGTFDPAFSPGYGEEVDFSQRCVLRGLVHVAADDVLVLHRGSASFTANSRQEEHEQEIARRYPYYHLVVDRAANRQTGPLPRSLAIAARALEGRPKVTIDARCLGPTVTGTQVHALELIHAL
ncbi:MAG TPA: glycosyltransferase, partial [Gaiellaceae bacterium]|nr:glycosyltransferase [Gaiellaceae bacterium]